MSGLNPLAVSGSCECPPGAENIPSDPQQPSVVSTSLVECFANQCGVCDDKIVAAPPAVAQVVTDKVCYQFDPGYCALRVRRPENTSNESLIIAVDPSRGAVVPGGTSCATLCEDADLLDVHAQYEMGGNHVYEWLPSVALTGPPAAPAATVALKFFVDPIYKHRVNCELGYVILGNHNQYNEWQPRSYVENHFVRTSDQPFSLGSVNLALDPAAALIGNELGTAPLIEVLVPCAPIARPLAVTTPLDTAVTSDLAGSSFTASSTAIIDPATVMLIDPVTGMKVPGPVVIAGEGSFDISAADGTVTFTPEAGFTGASSVQWCISDDTPLQSNAATYTVTIDAAMVDTPPVPPVANDVAGASEGLTTASMDAGAAATATAPAVIDVASLALIDPVSGAEVSSVTVAGQGVWAANSDGTITLEMELPGGTSDGVYTMDFVIYDDTPTVSNQATATVTVITG